MSRDQLALSLNLGIFRTDNGSTYTGSQAMIQAAQAVIAGG